MSKSTSARGARALPVLIAVVSLAVVALTILYQPAHPVLAADSTAPVLTAFDFSPRSVDVSTEAKTVTFTAEIRDEQGGSGVAVEGSYVQFSSPTTTQSFYVRLDAEHRISGDAVSSRYQFTQTVQAHAEAGAWTAVAWVSDVAGNKRNYTSQVLTSMGFPSTLVVVSAVSDTSPPQLAAFDFNPKSVDVSARAQTITVTARLIDASGAGTYVRQSQPSTAMFRSPSGQYADAIFDGAHPTSGTAKDGTYVVAMTIPAHAEPGKWTLDHVYLIDSLLNYSRIGPGTVAALGFPTSFTVVSTSADTTAPVLAGFDFTPKTVDTAGKSQTITFTAHITDDLSGVLESTGAVSQAHFYSPSRLEYISLLFDRHSSGTPLDGWYTETATLPAGSQPGTWTLGTFLLTDAAGNQRQMSAEQVAALGFPTSFVNGAGATTATATATSPRATATATASPPPATATRTLTATPPTAATSAAASATATPTAPSATPPASSTGAPTATASPTATPTRVPTQAAQTPGATATPAAPPSTGGDSGGAARTVMFVGLAAAVISVVGGMAFVVARRTDQTRGRSSA